MTPVPAPKLLLGSVSELTETAALPPAGRVFEYDRGDPATQVQVSEVNYLGWPSAGTGMTRVRLETFRSGVVHAFLIDSGRKVTSIPFDLLRAAPMWPGQTWPEIVAANGARQPSHVDDVYVG